MTSLEGCRMPFLSAGIAVFNPGKIDASQAKTRHQNETQMNWKIVRVTGLGKTLTMDLKEVLVSAEVMYQIMHNPYLIVSRWAQLL